MMTRVVVLFLDGVGLGDDDRAVNPLARASMPALTGALGGARLLATSGRVQTSRASLVPTDALLGVEGRPQSATGQAAILTGLNAPALLGEHYGPRPDHRLRQLLEGDTLFSRVLAAGGTACFANAYPVGYFAAIERGKRLHGAIPYAAQAAGLPLRTAEDLLHGRALSVDLTNAGWRNGLGYLDMPMRTPQEAGQLAAELACRHDLLYFDQWLPDMLGHRGDLEAAVTLFEQLDSFLGALLDALNLDETLVVLISDHGNVEDCSQRRHTYNPVPTVLIGTGHASLAASIQDLTDLAPALVSLLI